MAAVQFSGRARAGYDKDLPKVLDAVSDALRDARVPYRDCDINLVEATGEAPSVRIYNALRHAWVEVPEEGKDVILQFWREGSMTYRRDLHREDVYGDVEQIEEIYGHRPRSVVDVPFSGGTLAVNSDQPDGFSEADIEILQDVSQVLSEGFTRMEDLQRLAQRNRELEETVQLVNNFQKITEVAISSLTLAEVVDHLAQEIVRIGVFRSLMVALVDEEKRRVEVVANFVCKRDADVSMQQSALKEEFGIGHWNQMILFEEGVTPIPQSWHDALDMRRSALIGDFKVTHWNQIMGVVDFPFLERQEIPWLWPLDMQRSALKAEFGISSWDQMILFESARFFLLYFFIAFDEMGKSPK